MFGPSIFLYNQYRGVNLPALEFDCSIAFNAEVKNAWSCTSVSLRSLMAWTGKISPCDIYSSVSRMISKLWNKSEGFAGRVTPWLLFLTWSLLLSKTNECSCAPEDVGSIAYIRLISRDNSLAHKHDKRVTSNLPMLATLLVHVMAHGARLWPITAEVFELSPWLFHMVGSGIVIDFSPSTLTVPCE
jgi:hypothetical protein